MSNLAVHSLYVMCNWRSKQRLQGHIWEVLQFLPENKFWWEEMHQHARIYFRQWLSSIHSNFLRPTSYMLVQDIINRRMSHHQQFITVGIMFVSSWQWHLHHDMCNSSSHLCVAAPSKLAHHKAEHQMAHLDSRHWCIGQHQQKITSQTSVYFYLSFGCEMHAVY